MINICYYICMKYRKLIISIFLPLLAGFVGSFFTSPAIPGWYAMIEKPVFNPPSWVFGPVWTFLYITMGISAYLIWVKRSKKAQYAIRVFWIHLVFNSLWSIIFFGLQNPGLALICIFIILSFILYMIKIFWSIDKRASYLLVPYLAWVSFATVLNAFIWYLN